MQTYSYKVVSATRGTLIENLTHDEAKEFKLDNELPYESVSIIPVKLQGAQ